MTNPTPRAMSTRFVLVFVWLLLAGCGGAARFGATVTGHARTCIDGVEYLQFTSGVTVAYTTEGKVKTCR